MNEINRRVRTAKWRIVTWNFFQILTWSFLWGLLVSSIGMLIPKVWHLGLLRTQQYFEALRKND